MRILFTLLTGILCISLGWSAAAQDMLPPHPRLWITPSSLTQYRSWARPDNPFYSESLLPLAESARTLMDEGALESGDLGMVSYEDYPGETYANLFAFMSLIHPDAGQRADYAARARTLLMRIITAAAQGAAEGEPFRDPAFSTGDRSRWWGVSFALTVDWIYPSLSADDKALIRRVFLRWQDELAHAETTNMNHPEPIGMVNNPDLLSNPDAVRWSGNNYYTAHMRNMGMMALAFDPADDPDGALRGYLQQATGAWLYVNDHLMRTDAAGGFGTEGFEYSPQSVGYVAQFLLALHTSGMDDPAVGGQQVTFAGNPFWDDAVWAWFHSLSPATTLNADYDLPVYEPAWYGSGQDYLAPDPIQLFGAIAIYDSLVNNTSRLNAIRWLQTDTPMGGADVLLDRSNDSQELHRTILYYMLFDPTAPAPTDPRPNTPTLWYAPGLRRLLARTDWSADAAWLTYSLSWDRVDHQTANGNSFEFYRKGEWLTKVHLGYDLDYISSDHLNTLTVQNDPIDRNDWRLMLRERGSQWLYGANDPPPPVWSSSDDDLYISGDATPLYNNDYEELHGVNLVTRSLWWQKPDVLVIYDRAVTAAPDRIKRFMLNFPADGIVDDTRITMRTDSGQQLFITSLLPASAAITVAPLQDEASDAPAHFEPMRYRLEINAGGAPDVRFLTVLQGADAGVAPTAVTFTQCADSRFEGAQIGDTVVLFAHQANAPANDLTCALRAGTTRVILTDFTAGMSYDVNWDGAILTVQPGTSLTADAAGVLRLTF